MQHDELPWRKCHVSYWNDTLLKVVTLAARLPDGPYIYCQQTSAMQGPDAEAEAPTAITTRYGLSATHCEAKTITELLNPNSP